MKIKRFMAVALCLATILTVAAACKKDDLSDVTVYETDFWGETVTNEKGENVTIPIEGGSIEYVTDEDGNKLLDEEGEKVTILHYYVNDVDDQGNVVTNANKEPVTKVQVATPSTTGSSSFEDILGGGTEMPTVEVETMPEGTTVQTSQRLFDKNYRDIIVTGNFYVEMSMKSNVNGMGGMKTNVAYGMSGNKMYSKMNLNMGIMNITLECILKDDTAYTVYPKKKIYMEAAADGMIDMEDISSSLGSSDAVYQKTSIVTSKGVTYICEEYLVGDIIYKYYFDKNTEVLKKIEYDAGDGSMISMDIVRLAKNPEASLFNVPAGYKKVSEDEFANIITGGLMALVPTTKANG
ncbi:MAG: hypothetical protein IKL16_04750 [Clostridia bacterium]|nr:hypothetical protein [Clostridia bacterium]